MSHVMDEPDWRSRAQAHADRVDAFIQPHLARRESHTKHPVHDFLFVYYSHRPAQLRRWHPGFGIALHNAEDYADLKGYEVIDQAVQVSRSHVESQRDTIVSIHELLTATQSNSPNFGCFGLHEWAMVYRLHEDEVRHSDWPLRLGEAGTDAVVNSHRIACSHYDAYRFFTEPARPLNQLSPARGDRPAYEQPACLHANMDLYKHAYRLSPMLCSDVVADCFELAIDIRVLDMRASPYDLADLGFDPIKIETPQGKSAYAAHQRAHAERAAPLREQLIAECERLLAAGC